MNPTPRSNLRPACLLLALTALLASPIRGENEPQTADATPAESVSPEAIEQALGIVYRTGEIEVPQAKAILSLGDRFKFLDATTARKVLVDLWGNPPQAAESVLGLIIPGKGSVASDDSWAVILRSQNDGHVDDKDAASIQYDKLLKDMQKGAQTANAERIKAGFDPVHIIGWAARPYYDSTTHKLHWAKELAFGDPGTVPHTLNYDIRVLGRDSLIELTVVASTDQFESIKTEIEALLPLVNFKEGARYADYKPGSDKLAAYGIGGLVAGGMLAKAGFFKGLIAVLVAGKKLIIAAVIGAGVILAKMFSGGKKHAA